MTAALASFAISGALGLARQAAGGSPRTADAGAERARQTARDFETVFLEQALDRLIASTGDDGPLGENGTGGGVYRSLLVKEYAGSIVRSGGVGIADQVFREIVRLQEGTARPPGPSTQDFDGAAAPRLSARI